MALSDISKNNISFKKSVGKLQTKNDFNFFEERFASNFSIGSSTIFGDTLPRNPITGSISLYDRFRSDGTLDNVISSTDVVIERVRFEVEPIPDTTIAPNTSQAYRLKLPSDYGTNGYLGTNGTNEFSGGEILLDTLGRLQLVPELFGLTDINGNDYTPVVYESNGTTIISRFDDIDFIVDPYSGTIFIQDPPVGFDTSVNRPGFVEAFLYIGKFQNELNQSAQAGVLGPAETPIGTPTYTDGLFTDFTDTTPIGIAIDRFNELFKSIVPQNAPVLSNASISSSESFRDAYLGFETGNSLGYIAVPGEISGNIYSIGGDRLGVIKGTGNITGVLNDQVSDGDPSGSPYFNDSFGYSSDQTELRLYANATQIDSVDLTNAAAQSSTYLSVSAEENPRFDSGDALDLFVYRTGSFNIPTPGGVFNDGYNELSLRFWDGTTETTAFTKDFVLDSQSSQIILNGSVSVVTNPNVTIKYLSGVGYYRTASLDVSGTVDNAYRATYKVGDAIDLVALNGVETIVNANSISLSNTNGGTSSNRELPVINSSANTNYEAQLNFQLGLDVTAQALLGESVSGAVTVDDTFPTDNSANIPFNSSTILLFNVDQSTNFDTIEEFTTEDRRIQSDADFDVLTHTQITNATWDSQENLLSTANPSYQGGLHVQPVDGSITTGIGRLVSIDARDFNAGGVAVEAPASNANYSGYAPGGADIRSYVRRFTGTESDNPQFTLVIDHTGSASDFLTDPDETGTPSANQVKVEFGVKDIATDTFNGLYNPFATSSNANTDANVAIIGSPVDTTFTDVDGTTVTRTTITCTFGGSFTVSVGDHLIIKIKVDSAAYTNEIRRLEVQY